MSGTNVGSLNATLTLSAFEFQNGLKQSAAAALEFEQATVASANRANAAMARVGKGGGFDSGGAARAVQQIGFGIQDFASQFETRGLAGGISAVSNNVQMLGAAFGPVGLAITAVGGALGGILLPKLIEASGLFKDNKEAIDENASSIAKWRKEMSDAAKLEQEYIEGGTAELNVKQGARREELNMLNKQRRELEMGIRRDEEVVRNADEERRRLDNQGGFASWFGAPNVSDNGAGARLQAQRNELAKVTDEANKLTIAMTTAERIRPKVDKAEAGRDAIEEFRNRQEAMNRGREAIEKLQRKGLEEYGDAHSQLIEKQKRERTELEELTIGLREREEALAQQADMHAVERKKLQISEQEKALAKLGPDAKASAGLDVASAEGIRAINNAISGRGENSMQKEQLEIEKQQLIALEALASGKAEGKALSFAAKGAGDSIELGAASSMGERNRDGSFVRYRDDGSTVSGRFPEETQGMAPAGRSRLGADQSTQWASLNRKREREAADAEAVRDKITQYQAEKAKKQQADSDRLWAGVGGGKTQGVEDDGIKLLRKIADKPTMKVVALSGG